ncbi:hypothetical protein DB30_05857 [Enhygromyxa salina]|uniref:Uncharacterized protein n=1 Tax=Enhygromyxa salina TaxID=215803 RepID=A0A0C2D531_9BACT|nr:MXAN_2562 family outer membrane beta-barrel protein [Enhygromyxa salina]KIG15157.1 hypothetical protein DB30_05857 [Enhygromyxa salina]
MSAILSASLVLAFAAPPPPPPSSGDGGDETSEDTSEDTATPAEDELAPAPAPEPAPDPTIPLDERYDPILPYGESSDQPELEYADETPPPPELEYAAETPPEPALDYDQSRQRPAPGDDALARESDQQNDLGKDEFQGRVESPQRFAIEVKFGPYLPDVDHRYTGDGFGPYANIYGRVDDLGATIKQPAKGLFSVVGFEWQFVHFGGPFSVGTTIGLFRDRANALVAEPVEDGESLRSAADKTFFSVIPVTVLLGYRLEVLADRFRVPLVPYARGGVAYGFWWERKGAQLATNSAGQKARGGSWGWQVNLGLMLRLDFIERGTAIDLDRLTGINHTYVFGEWQFSHLDGFGSDAAMTVGDDTFLVGLAFEF